MTEITLEPAVPILRIYDLAKAKEFYVDFLGFKVDWEHRFDENAPLHFQVRGPTILLPLSGARALDPHGATGRLGN